MPSIVERLQEPIFATSVVIFVVASLLLNYLTTANLVLSLLGGILIAGGTYMLYSDFTEKQKISKARAAKDQDLKRRKMEQAEAEAETGKCISCLTPLPADAKECPSCGFKVKHYSVDKESQPVANAED